jgi:hypothetical protein
VGQHEQPGAGLGGDPARLPGRQVPVVAGQPGVGVCEGGLADQHVRVCGQLERGVAEPGVHDEGETLPAPGLADLLERDSFCAGDESALALQSADVGTGDAADGEFTGEHAPAVRLGQPVADGGHEVGQRAGLQAEGGAIGYRAIAAHRPLAQRERVMEQRRVPQAREELLVLPRVIRVHLVRHPVQGHPREHTRQAKTVIAVEVGETDPGDLARRHAGEQHLPLRTLPGVEQQSLVVPAQEVTVVIAGSGGRLARRAENHQLTIGHDTRA